MSDKSESLAKEEVVCRKCHAKYVPNFQRDFYPDGNDPKVGLCERCMMNAAFGASSPEPHKLTDDHSERICQRGKGAVTCSFLMFGGNGFECGKSSSFEGGIRQKLAAGTLKSKGDNCSGPPNFTPTPSSIEDKVGQALAEAGGLTGNID